WIRISATRIRDKKTKIRRNVVRRGQCSHATLLRWLYELAVFILQSRGVQSNLLGEFITDVANRSVGLSDETCDALVALPSHRVSRPIDHCGRTELVAPLFADRVEVFGERESRSTTVLTNHGRNRQIGKFDSGIRLGDQRIVPLLDLAEKYTCVSSA